MSASRNSNFSQNLTRECLIALVKEFYTIFPLCDFTESSFRYCSFYADSNKIGRPTFRALALRESESTLTKGLRSNRRSSNHLRRLMYLIDLVMCVKLNPLSFDSNKVFQQI